MHIFIQNSISMPNCQSIYIYRWWSMVKKTKADKAKRFTVFCVCGMWLFLVAKRPIIKCSTFPHVLILFLFVSGTGVGNAAKYSNNPKRCLCVPHFPNPDNHLEYIDCCQLSWICKQRTSSKNKKKKKKMKK